ncbi:MAG: 3-oxoacyl-ACP reductase FabG [Clostridiales bacterium]|jgi:3-oxoacyl-[acyl-carrier protein] reductase|nr:3-oxoacyl-ACP reductase FabG [Clostridiales bacterium]
MTVLVTGGSRGIGAQIVRDFAARGWNVGIIYLNSRENAESLVAETKIVGGNGLAVACDVRDENSVADMYEQVTSEFGKVDVLVNNAGISAQKLFTDLSVYEWDDMFAVHCRGAFNCAKAVLPEMIKNKNGVIINISSIWGQIGGACEVHYSAAKAALIGFTKALAKETAASGVRVNAIAPGAIKTDMLNVFNDAEINEIIDKIPVGRLGVPSDVSQLALFLASPQADFITGQVFSCNGGEHV